MAAADAYVQYASYAADERALGASIYRQYVASAAPEASSPNASASESSYTYATAADLAADEYSGYRDLPPEFKREESKAPALDSVVAPAGFLLDSNAQRVLEEHKSILASLPPPRDFNSDYQKLLDERYAASEQVKRLEVTTKLFILTNEFCRGAPSTSCFKLMS